MARAAARTAGVLVAALCAGCGGKPTPPPASHALDGLAYISTGSTGHALRSPDAVRISFVDGQYSVTGGCNDDMGTYSFAGHRLRMRGDDMSTMIACDPKRTAFESWLFDWADDVELERHGRALTPSRDGTTIRGKTSQKSSRTPSAACL